MLVIGLLLIGGGKPGGQGRASISFARAGGGVESVPLLGKPSGEGSENSRIFLTSALAWAKRHGIGAECSHGCAHSRGASTAAA